MWPTLVFNPLNTFSLLAKIKQAIKISVSSTGNKDDYGKMKETD